GALRGVPHPLEPLDVLEPVDATTDPQDLAAGDHARAWAALLAGDPASALEHARRATGRALGAERLRALELTARAELWAGDLSALRTTIASMHAMGVKGRWAGAAALTLAAAAGALAGEADAPGRYSAAAAAWRDLRLPLHLALCLLEWHRFAGGDAEALAEGLGVCRGLGALGLARLVESADVS
ncbi:MAG: hypothetical protein ABI622_07830, partial [Chloroflexota bacterium]